MDVDFDELLFQSKSLTTEFSDGSFRKKLRSTLAQPVSQFDPEETLESSDIEGFMQHHHDMIIFAAIEEGKKASSADVDAIYKGWASKEWNDTKNKMMERLGHRQVRTPLGDAMLPSAGPRMTSSTTSFNAQSGAAERSSNTIGRTPLSSFPLLPIGTQTIKSSPLLAAHTEIFRQLNSSQNSQNAPSSPALTISNFDESILCGDGSAGGDYFDAADALGYKNMMFLMSNVANENSLTTNGRVCGRYAAVAFANDDTNNVTGSSDVSLRSVKASQFQLTSGCKNYFQYIFWNYLQDVIDHSFKQGHRSSYPPAAPGHSNRRVLLMYLDIIRKSVGFAQGSVYQKQPQGGAVKVRYCSVFRGEDVQLASSTPLWIFVYYCLRIGELGMAIDELQSQQDQDQDQDRIRGAGDATVATDSMYLNAVLETLWAIQTQVGQSTSGSFGSNSSINNPGVSACAAQCRAMYVDLMDEADERRWEHPRTVEPYLLHLLRMLSVSDVEIAADNVKNQSINFTTTVEDYLWCNVWYIWLSHLVQHSQATDSILGSSQSGSNSRGAERVPEYTEEDFARAVESYGGQAYFDPSYAAPYQYVTVLLCGQRYGEAVMHLWVAGKKFASMQLCSVCLYYGMLLPHVAMPSVLDVSASTSALVRKPTHLTTSISSQQQQSYSCSPVELLLQWASGYLVGHSMDLIEYLLLCQNDAWFSVIQECCGSTLQKKLREDANRVCVDMWGNFLFRVMDTSASGNRDVLLQLVGSVSSDPRLRDPKRLRDGYMDRFQCIYPSSDYVDRILASVAQKLLQSFHSSNLQRGVVDVRAVSQEKCNNALSLFMMTGHFVDVVLELNKQLSNVLAHCVTVVAAAGGGPRGDVRIQLLAADTSSTANAVSSNNSYWLNKCLDFYKAYIDGGTGEVVNVLRSQGQIDSAKTLEVLLNVAQAFDFFSRDQLQEGLSVCESIALFPTNMNEITARSESYYQLSDTVRAVVPDLLLLSMRAMKSLYDSCLAEKRGNSMFGNRLSSGSGSVSVSDIDRSMSSLQERSRALYMYLEAIRSRGISKPEVISHVHAIAHAMM